MDSLHVGVDDSSPPELERVRPNESGREHLVEPMARDREDVLHWLYCGS